MKKYPGFLISICVLLCAMSSSANAAPPLDEVYRMIRSDDVRAFREALADGLDPNGELGSRGLTPLHVAVLSNSFGIAQELLAAGAEVDAEDYAGTPLLGALLAVSTKTADKPIRESQMKIIALLLDRGANPNALNEFGDSPLNLAASVGNLELCLEITRRLIERGANVNARNDLSLTPLHDAFTVFVTKAPDPKGLRQEPESRAPLVALLLASGANVNARSIDGETPLFYALDDPESMKLLLDAGARIDVKNNKDETPLDVALKESPAAAELLFKQIAK